MDLQDEKLKSRPASSWSVWAVPCALTLAAVIYGSWSVIAKAALTVHGVSPLVLAFYRACAGSAVMFLMHRVLEKEDTTSQPFERCSIPRVPRADVGRFLGLGVLLAMNMGGNILALKSLSPITVSIFQPLLPVVAGIAAAILGIEELSPLKAFGILCATSGAVLVVLFGPSHRHHAGPVEGANPAGGIVCLLINVFGGAMYIVFQKSVLKRYPPIATAATSFAAAGCIIFIVAVCTVGFDSWAWRLGGSRKAVLALLYAVFLTTALNYSLMAWANKNSTPTTVTSFMTLQPISAAVLSCIFLHEVLTWGEVGGAIAIVVGLVSFVLAKPVEADTSEAEPILSQKAAAKTCEKI